MRGDVCDVLILSETPEKVNKTKHRDIGAALRPSCRSHDVDAAVTALIQGRTLSSAHRCQPSAQPCWISIEAVQCRIYLGELRSLSVLDHFHDGRSKQALPGGPRLLTPTHFCLSFKRVDKIQQLWRIQFTANEMLDFMSIKLNSSKTTSYTNTLYLHSLYF